MPSVLRVEGEFATQRCDAAGRFHDQAAWLTPSLFLNPWSSPMRA